MSTYTYTHDAPCPMSGTEHTHEVTTLGEKTSAIDFRQEPTECPRCGEPWPCPSAYVPQHYPKGIGVSGVSDRECACGEPWPCPSAATKPAVGSVAPVTGVGQDDVRGEYRALLTDFVGWQAESGRGPGPASDEFDPDQLVDAYLDEYADREPLP